MSGCCSQRCRDCCHSFSQFWVDCWQRSYRRFCLRRTDGTELLVQEPYPLRDPLIPEPGPSPSPRPILPEPIPVHMPLPRAVGMVDTLEPSCAEFEELIHRQERRIADLEEDFADFERQLQ
jgi:hypothetical protein